MRTLLGVVVGLVLGAILVAAISMSPAGQAFWPIVPAGLVVGLAARKMTAGDPPSIVRGALAAVATVLAMIGGQMGAAEVISKQGPKDSTIRVAAEKAEATNAEDSADAAEAPTPVAAPLATSDQPVPGSIGAPRQQGFPVGDAVWLAVGCLIAYEVGKGAAAPKDTSEESSEEEGAPAGDAASEESAGDSEENS